MKKSKKFLVIKRKKLTTKKIENRNTNNEKTNEQVENQIQSNENNNEKVDTDNQKQNDSPKKKDLPEPPPKQSIVHKKELPEAPSRVVSKKDSIKKRIKKPLPTPTKKEDNKGDIRESPPPVEKGSIKTIFPPIEEDFENPEKFIETIKNEQDDLESNDNIDMLNLVNMNQHLLKRVGKTRVPSYIARNIKRPTLPIDNTKILEQERLDLISQGIIQN